MGARIQEKGAVRLPSGIFADFPIPIRRARQPASGLALLPFLGAPEPRPRRPACQVLPCVRGAASLRLRRRGGVCLTRPEPSKLP